LTAIYTELESIEAHKAESRAAVILSGLGFTSQMQSMATKYFIFEFILSNFILYFIIDSFQVVGECVLH
jgi:hypothetical protein